MKYRTRLLSTPLKLARNPPVTGGRTTWPYKLCRRTTLWAHLHLPPRLVWDCVHVQNQIGLTRPKWYKKGIVEVYQFDKYVYSASGQLWMHYQLNSKFLPLVPHAPISMAHGLPAPWLPLPSKGCPAPSNFVTFAQDVQTSSLSSVTCLDRPPMHPSTPWWTPPPRDDLPDWAMPLPFTLGTPPHQPLPHSWSIF